jgi:hypothetical protein
MAANIFLSYSRQCIGFVDDLAHQLQKRGFHVWLDYLSLIPGRPWLEQIHRGLDEAELLLLVVSPESISSGSVDIEWRHFLEHNKRIILLIFQAVPLPPELADLEWVDFRGSYPAALKNLLQLIDSPVAMEQPAPQSGFKAPWTVWLAFGLSLITSIYSLFAFWTILIPRVLIPLPGRILKRDFNFQQVQTALWTQPIALFFTLGILIEFGIYKESTDFDYVNVFSLYNIILMILFLQIYFIPLISFLLLAVLNLPSMQRWGKPQATRPKFANLHHPNITQPQPVYFYIDHADQDRVIARELEATLTRYKHIPAESITTASEVLVLISRFKSDTEADPEKQVVYPVLVQRTRISEKLSPMQWIDFRKGVRNLDAIAQLLPEPTKMLAALGVRPSNSGQASMPNIILAWVDMLIIMAMVNLGSFLAYMMELIHMDLALVFQKGAAVLMRPLTLHLLYMTCSGVLIYFMVRALTERRGWFASPLPFLLGLYIVWRLFLAQAYLGDEVTALFLKYGISSNPMFANLPFFLLLVAILLVGFLSLFRWKDIRRWFPARMKMKGH